VSGRATTPSIFIPIDERRFLFMVQQTPFFALRVMRLLTARFRAIVLGWKKWWGDKYFSRVPATAVS
jgi:hypothetical protein